MTAAKKKPRIGGSRAEANTVFAPSAQCSGRSSRVEAQRQRILTALRQRPQTTEDLRKLGIFQAATRVKELRDRFGYRIETSRVTLIDREGWEHPRAGLYSLLEEPEGAA